MVNSIRKRKKSGGEQGSRNEGGTQSADTVNPKLDRMAWINFHKQERQIKTGKGNKKSMEEIRQTWNNMSIDEKSKYKVHNEDIVDDKGHSEEGAEDSKVLQFDTRCTPAGCNIVTVDAILNKAHPT
ncbi:hypothetical protein LWI29_015209 [Acer saccharum]|uniref:Uncharacterized protein n=1 Tax=Acer saccharum TaxID=4024 RepID=A0AA39V138_ACESA|nr:hypothetical protein LWI29_015209 [Acer saccharum]